MSRRPHGTKSFDFPLQSLYNLSMTFDIKEYYKKNKERILKYQKKHREENKEHYNAYMREYNQLHKKEYDARIAVEVVRNKKQLTKQPCEVCGDLNVVAHHCDYNKPLDVMWLCRKHHAEWHKNNTPIH